MSFTTCHTCSRPLSITAAKVVVDSHWLCPDCALLAENPDAAIAEKPPPAVPLKTYELFDSREYVRR